MRTPERLIARRFTESAGFVAVLASRRRSRFLRPIPGTSAAIRSRQQCPRATVLVDLERDVGPRTSTTFQAGCMSGVFGTGVGGTVRNPDDRNDITEHLGIVWPEA